MTNRTSVACFIEVTDKRRDQTTRAWCVGPFMQHFGSAPQRVEYELNQEEQIPTDVMSRKTVVRYLYLAPGESDLEDALLGISHG